jgi:hypothetical protein
MTFEKWKKFIEIACHEARAEIHTTVAALRDTVEQYKQLPPAAK